MVASVPLQAVAMSREILIVSSVNLLSECLFHAARISLLKLEDLKTAHLFAESDGCPDI